MPSEEIMSREAMKQALEALELLARYENPSTKIQVRKPKDGGPIVTMYPHKVATEASALLRERLAQPEQEPVAWRWKERINNDFDSWVISASEPPPYAIEQQPLYTSPPQRELTCVCGAVWEGEMMVHPPRKREWIGLTDEEMEALFLNEDSVRFARYIESRLKDKNA
jgi:hypothetical protein